MPTNESQLTNDGESPHHGDVSPSNPVHRVTGESEPRTRPRDESTSTTPLQPVAPDNNTPNDTTEAPPRFRRRFSRLACCACTRHSTCQSTGSKGRLGCSCVIAGRKCVSCACFKQCRNLSATGENAASQRQAEGSTTISNFFGAAPAQQGNNPPEIPPCEPIIEDTTTATVPVDSPPRQQEVEQDTNTNQPNDDAPRDAEDPAPPPMNPPDSTQQPATQPTIPPQRASSARAMAG